MARYRYRSAIDGRIVTKEYAELHPDTTVREKIGIVERIVRAARRKRK